jgi:hypothetical protein
LARESEQARLFTLLHELAHLCLRGEGVCEQFEDASLSGRVEAYCNRVAAAALLPTEIVDECLQRAELAEPPSEWKYDDMRAAARVAGVSAPALALRLQSLGRADGQLYFRLMAEAIQRPVDRSDVGGGGGKNSWPGTRIAERGESFSAAVERSWRSGNLSIGDAARVLNIRVQYVPRLADSLSSRRSRRKMRTR